MNDVLKVVGGQVGLSSNHHPAFIHVQVTLQASGAHDDA
jgi:hypothetical protein